MSRICPAWDGINGVDSDEGDNDFTPFRNLFNDFYARDTSKKIRAVMRAKGNAGERLCSNPPYGYVKDPNDKKKWIVDEEAAETIKRIFDMCVAGKGLMQMAKALTADEVFEKASAKRLGELPQCSLLSSMKKCGSVLQELRANKRRPAKQARRQGVFFGLLYCADCGSKLHFATGKNMSRGRIVTAAQGTRAIRGIAPCT